MSYFCWATLMNNHYQNDVVANMIKKDYHVRGGLIGGGFISKSGDMPVLIMLVDSGSSKKEPTAKTILEDFKSSLKESKAKYYSVIVTVQGDSAYDTSNIVLPENPEQPSRPAME